ncbi:MAG: protein kinase [Planctomycetes bacterium]|nr:protein kinase [Planctomycetota bacterium]
MTDEGRDVPAGAPDRSDEPERLRRAREERLDALYERLLPLSPAERAAVLQRECADDPALAARLLSLFGDAPPTDFLVPPASRESAERYFGGGLAGERLGDFTLLRELGRGSMGVVYLAEQGHPRRHVALKLLPVAQAQDPSRAERFRREATTLSKLDHPGIVPILAYGEERGLLWYAMRYVEGHDLHEELDRQRRLRSAQATPLPFLPAFDGADYLPRMLERFCELLDALQFAHDAFIVHRDVKPQNVLLGTDGRFYLADFGLARDERFGSLTATGAVQGTPYYMSPEQAAAVTQGIDHRTDVYSAAVVLYELLCLQRAFTGSTQQEILQKIGTREPRPLELVEHRIPRDLAVVCGKAMEKKPAKRYASAREFADDLRRFLRHEAIRARPPSFLERASRVAERHRSALLAAAAAALVLSLGAYVVQDLRFREVVAGDEQTIGRLLDEPDWTTRTNELVLARDRLATLRASGRSLPVRASELLDRFEARLASFKAERRAKAEALLVSGRSGRAFPRAASVLSPEEQVDPNVVRELRTGRNDEELDAAMRILESLATVFGDDAELRAAFDLRRAQARLTVELPTAVRDRAARWSEARAFLRRVDPIRETIGALEPLGVLPLLEVPVASGEYRIVVEIPDYGFGEFTRTIGVDSSDCTVRAWVRSTSEVRASLRRIDACTFRYRAEGLKMGMGCSEEHDHVELATYWVSEAAVSNGEVLQYLRETGTRIPHLWVQAGFVTGPEDFGLTPSELAEWYERPATGFHGLFARDVAEYLGGRLPTHPELERVKRGLAALYYPWGDEPDLQQSATVRLGIPPALRDLSIPKKFRAYFGGTRGVRDPAYRQGPEGFFHTYGNVSEWTESCVVELRTDLLVVDPNQHITMGPAWHSPTIHTLCNHNLWSVDERYSTFDTGLRVAKSDVP